MKLFTGLLAVALAAPVPIIFGQSLSHTDSAFLKDAAEGGMNEVRLGELAQKNASSQQVKDFGKRMVTDHTKMGEEIKALAALKNVTLPTDIGITDKASNKLLSNKTGADFDKAYISDMIKDHEKDVAAFEKERAATTDAEIKALVTKALPTIRQHLDKAREIATQLGFQVGD